MSQADLSPSQRVLVFISEYGIAMLIGAGFACTGVIASLGTDRDLWWSLTVQVAAIAIGMTIGVLLGRRAGARRRARIPAKRPTSPAMHVRTPGRPSGPLAA